MATAASEVERDGDEIIEAEVMSGSMALTANERASLDVQIATAKAYPRSVRRSLDEAMGLATMNEETAASMFYVLPRGGKKIQGPSARLAELILYSWGNARGDARVVAVDETHVTAQGTYLDLEKNIGVRFEVKRRITDSKGRRYDDDLITVTGNAAASIAFRNAVLKGIPAALVQRIYQQAILTATGKGQPIETRRQKLLAWFANVGRQEDEVLRVLGVGSVEQIGEEQIETLVGLKSGIREGTVTIESAFAAEGGKSTATASLNDKLGMDAMRKLYFAKWNELRLEGERPDQLEKRRHAWQAEHMGAGNESTKGYGKSDFKRAIDMLESGIGV